VSDTIELPFNKDIPLSIKPACLKALSYFPELNHTRIEFRLQRNKYSTMMAQPQQHFMIQSKRNRSYVIKMNASDEAAHLLNVEKIPFDVQVGWIGHELGHLIDYSTKNVLTMIGFGIGYFVSHHFRIGAERIADLIAIEKGMGSFILAAKNYILSNERLSEKYKNRIKNYYMSPEETMYVIDQLQKQEEQNEWR